jgi:hypothetical protein
MSVVSDLPVSSESPAERAHRRLAKLLGTEAERKKDAA